MELSKQVHDQIIGWASKHPTIEVTGFVKRMPTGQQVHVPMTNEHPEPTKHYRWSMSEMVVEWDKMDHEMAKPIAYYHSHPNGLSEPSETDMTAALQPGLVYLIAYPESQELTSGDGPEPIARVTQWQLSAWLCLEMGILVGEDLRVV